MKLTHEYKEDVGKLFSLLPYGGIAEIARRLDTSSEQVRTVRDFKNMKSMDMEMHAKVIAEVKKYLLELEQEKIKRHADLKDFLQRFKNHLAPQQPTKAQA